MTKHTFFVLMASQGVTDISLTFDSDHEGSCVLLMKGLNRKIAADPVPFSLLISNEELRANGFQGPIEMFRPSSTPAQSLPGQTDQT